ncbi:MAG: hypothetical protein ACKPGT_26985 [Microcystis sp.]
MWGGHCVRVAGGVGVLVEIPHFPVAYRQRVRSGLKYWKNGYLGVNHDHREPD